MKSLTLVLVGSLALSACNKKAVYVDPDARSRVEGTGLEARDVRAIVEQMTDEMVSSPLFKQKADVPRVALLPMENRTRFLIDQEIFDAMMTDELIRSSQGRLGLVNRDLLDEILAERARKRSGAVDTEGSKALAGVDFFLEGTLTSLSASTQRAQTDYVVVQFQLTDAESGIIAWSNRYEMKKEGSWGVLYQ
jgi:PBP1b-binding outer membrane lipoprotein LpoB